MNMKKHIFMALTLVAAIVCAATLYAEKRFNMTVKLNNGRTLNFNAPELSKIAVDTTGIGNAQWGTGGDIDISSEEVDIDYGPVKVGDYFYNDGSWSDGGFLGYDTTGHGSLKWVSPKPAPTNVNPITGETRQVVGIVFSTDSNRLGQAEKQALAAAGTKFHGLVMGLKNITNTRWSTSNVDDTQFGLPNIAGSATTPFYTVSNAQISGLDNCMKIKTNNAQAYNAGFYPALKATMEADGYAATAGGPAKGTRTTGWFMASTGQWFDLLRNFTGMNLTDTAPFYFTYNEYEVDDYMHFDWQIDYSLSLQAEYHENFMQLLNVPLSTVPASFKEDFSSAYDFYLTSTVSSTENIFFLRLLPKIITCRRWQKTTNSISVRPILAF